MARRSQITREAIDCFGLSSEAIAFLNGQSDDLGGRPLDLATDSEAGLTAVGALLLRLDPKAG